MVLILAYLLHKHKTDSNALLLGASPLHVRRVLRVEYYVTWAAC